MDSKIASDEKNNFSKRLNVALTSAGVLTSPAAFARAYNARADGAAVSVYAARKWLAGEAIPTHEKIVILSTWLGVSPAWLRFGDATVELSHEVIPESEISTPALSLVNDILSLPKREQQMVREIVDAFLKHYIDR